MAVSATYQCLGGRGQRMTVSCKQPDPGGPWTLGAVRSARIGQLARFVRASRKTDPEPERSHGTRKGGVGASPRSASAPFGFL